MMDEDFELTRRKILAGLGTVGVASAGAGLGTSAYFSDQETFDGNELVAGSLDMKMAYSAHYSDWSDDEGEGVDVEMWGGEPGTTGGPGNLAEGRTGLPTNAAWLISVDDPDQFLANTQYADAGSASCPDGTDSGDLDQPVIELDDVKPGDFGEVTFDFALCDNPGFVWLQGALQSASENGYSEPEAKDEDESGDADEDGEDDRVELLDVVQAAAWVDDGNNYQNGDEAPLLVGSLRDVLESLNEGMGAPLEGDIPAEDGGGAGRNCFSAGTTHSVAFAWWVPVDHGNEIQTDSATFELSFYTEQCRHNQADGVGEVGECPDCSFDLGSTGDDASNLLSVGPDPSTGFPDIDARVRVDSPQGNAGDLTASNFAICEDGCGQPIDDVVFESGGIVDIVVVFDDTGSMSGEISTLKSQVTSLTSDIESAGIDARYALVSFKDEVELDTDFTDASTFQSSVDALSASGGGDTPEDNIDALAVGTGNAPTEGGASLSSFRSGAQRIVIDITDVGAYDSEDDPRARFTQAEIESFLNDGNFTLYAVAPASTSSFSPVSKRDIANNVDDGEWLDIDGADFSVILDDIVAEITDPAYVLSYTTTNPATDGSTRTVDVEIDDPDEGMLYEEGSYDAPS